MNEEPRRLPGRPRKPERIVGRDPLGRFPYTHDSQILALQGVDNTPRPNVRMPNELHELIEEAPEESEAPSYQSKRPRTDDEPVKRDPTWMPEPALGDEAPPLRAFARRRR